SAVSSATAGLFAAARDRASVRSTQFTDSRCPSSQISFGRMANDEKSAAKWNHREDGVLMSGSSAHFLGCEVWTPSWTVCEREQNAPDVFLFLGNEDHGAGADVEVKRQFTSRCILAVACDLGDETRTGARRGALEIANALFAPLRAMCTRPWG